MRYLIILSLVLGCKPVQAPPIVGNSKEISKELELIKNTIEWCDDPDIIMEMNRRKTKVLMGIW